MGNGKVSVKREAVARVVRRLHGFVTEGGDEGRRMRGNSISNDKGGSTKMMRKGPRGGG